MCDRFVSENPFMIIYCFDRYKNQRICDEHVNDRLKAFKFIPDWFVPSKIVETFYFALVANVMIYSFSMKILIRSHLLLIEGIFLLKILVKLNLRKIIILMKMIFIPLFMSEFWLDVVN